jgi:Leucine-rich repeat (LRR) protein
MDYRFFHSIVKEVYTDIPNPQMPPQGHLRDLRRYAGAFDGLELGLEESYCFFNLRSPGEEPVVYLGKTGRKHNAVSEGNFLQCVGWKQTGDVLLEHFDEILGARFHTEAEVDAFAERGTVPSEEGKPMPRVIEPVKVEREAIRAVLYGTMLRWQQGTPQIHIAVPKAEMERYNDYVLGAVKTIWSYFPAYMRAAVGFTSYLSSRRERDFSKFSVIFIPFHMADVNTIRLDGSSPNAYAAMIRSTGMQQLDMVLETLASLDDPEERKSFLQGLFDDVEKEADLKTRAFSPMAYVKWGRGLELLNAKGEIGEQIPEWIKFARTKDSFPAAISRKVDQYIDRRLTPEELNKALEQELRGGRPSLAILDKVVEDYQPLCATRPACREALWTFVRDSLGQAGLPADHVYQILQEREKSWSTLTDPKRYGELVVSSGRQAALANKARTESLIREAGNVAMKQDTPNSTQLRDRLTKLRMQFREESAEYVDEVSLKEMDTELRGLQRGCVAMVLDRELQAEAQEQPRGHQAIQAEKKRVADLAALLPSERSPQEQELFLRIQQRQNQLQAMLTDASTVSADLQQRLRSVNNYFEALDVAAAQAEVISAADRDRLRSILAEKRPNKRSGYLESFRMHYGQSLSIQVLKKKKAFFRDCVEEDLVRLFDQPQPLELRGADNTALLRQIQTMKRESELFGSTRGLRVVLGQDVMDADVVERMLGLQPKNVVGQEKQRVGDTGMALLRNEIYDPDQLCSLLKMFEAADCSIDKPVKAVLNGEGGSLNQQQMLNFLRQAMNIQQQKGQDRDQALGWISERLDTAGNNPVAEAAFKALVAEGKRGGKGKGLWITLTAVLAALLIGAVLWIILGKSVRPSDANITVPQLSEDPEEKKDEGILKAFTDADSYARGCFDLSGSGLNNAKLQEAFGYYWKSAAFVNGQVPPAILEDPALLNELGYRPTLDLSDNPDLTDLSNLNTLTGLRRLYLDNCGVRLISGIYDLKNLELLSLRGLPLTEDQVRPISEFLPDCVILWNQGGQEKLSLAGSTYVQGQPALYLSGSGAALARVLDDETVVADLKELQELHLEESTLPALEGLAGLEALRYLDLSDSTLPEDALTVLSGMQKLSVLDLEGSSLDEDAVATLKAALPSCVIYASEPAVPGAVKMVTICGETYPEDTEKLDLSGKTLSAQDTKEILKLKNLKELNLSWTQLGDVEFVREIYSLKILNISDNNVTDLSPLWKLGELERVYAENNPIEKIGMTQLIPASTLHFLSLSGASQELDLDCLQFAPNLVVLDLGDLRENPDKPLAETFRGLAQLRILKLRDRTQLNEASLAALDPSCAVLVTGMPAPAPAPAPDAAATPAPDDGQTQADDDGQTQEDDDGQTQEDQNGETGVLP